MEKFLFLKGQKEDINKLKSDTERIIRRIDQLHRRVVLLRQLPSSQAKNEDKNTHAQEKKLTFLAKLKNFFYPKQPTIGETLAELAVLQCKKQHLIKEISYAEQYEQFLISAKSNFEFSSDAVLWEDFVSEDDLIGFAVFLNNRVENLERFLFHITMEMKKLILDKRARFRSIINLLFKNLDDEHSVVNNLTAIAVNRYLRINPHYGNRTFKTITCNSR